MMFTMLRALVLATLPFAVLSGSSGQPVGVLHIKVVLLDAGRNVTPVPRHALLVSDDPPSTAPRRAVTALDGTAQIRLRPGTYVVESDRPTAFEGRAYQWRQMVNITAGGDAVLELTSDNAEIEPLTAATTATAPLEADPSALLMRWQDSVVALWTPTTRATGFVIDANGLVATSQRVIGAATSIEVQLTPAVKVSGSVVVADAARDVAILRIDPKVLASVRPVPLECGAPVRPTLVDGQELFTIGVPLRGQKRVTWGTVSRKDPRTVQADFILASGSAGGPVFGADGGVLGITSVVDESDAGRRDEVRIVPTDAACDVVASAEKKMAEAAPPDGTPLPVEPLRPFPVDALREAAERRAGSLSPYQMSSSDFDIAFITPVLIYGAQYQAEQMRGRERGGAAPRPDEDPAFVRPLLDFGHWSDYVADVPPVLLVRVTPRLVEGFWTTVARGAAYTQGVSLPPMKRPKSGFSRMRALCGDAEVIPIHPFKLEQRVSESDAIYEGLYVFDPGALGPQCETVKLLLYSEKEPEKADTRVVDPKVIQQIRVDFAPYRAQE